jgi:hypothetical protein
MEHHGSRGPRAKECDEWLEYGRRVESLFSVTTGTNNVAMGFQSLYGTTGGNNIGIGYAGGNLITSGSDNIAIGSSGANADNGIIRIGTPITHTATYIAGIRDANAGGNTVYVTSSGQLSSLSSSRRFTHDIHDMGDTTSVIMGLRPVRFRYNSHGPDGPVQYGLIAEEVDKVAPEIVGHDTDGQIDSVNYER